MDIRKCKELVLLQADPAGLEEMEIYAARTQRVGSACLQISS